MQPKKRIQAISALRLFASVSGYFSLLGMFSGWFLGLEQLFYTALAMVPFSLGARWCFSRLTRDFKCSNCGTQVSSFSSLFGQTRFVENCLACGASVVGNHDGGDGTSALPNAAAKKQTHEIETATAIDLRGHFDVASPYKGSVQREQLRRAKRSLVPTIVLAAVILVAMNLFFSGTDWTTLAPMFLTAVMLLLAVIFWQSAVRCPKCELPVWKASKNVRQPGGAPPDSCPRCGNAWNIGPAGSDKLSTDE